MISLEKQPWRVKKMRWPRHRDGAPIFCERRAVSFPSILLLALGLSMDAMAAAAARGASAKQLLTKNVLLVAGLFGGFQALMPLIGWFVGSRVGSLVAAWDHWIAFVILAIVGGKMIWEAVTPGETVDADFGLKVLVMLAIATSIDALAVGLTLPMLDAPLLLSIVTIGVTTALLSAAGLYVGRRLGSMVGKRFDLVGGLVLVGLGTKILVEHLVNES